MLSLLGLGCRRGLQCFDDVHGRLDDMGFDIDRNISDLGHAVFRWVLRVFLQNSFALVWFRPIFLEQAFVDPFMP